MARSEPAAPRLPRHAVLLAALGGVVVALFLAIYLGSLWLFGSGGRVYRNATRAMEPTLLAGDQFTVTPLRPPDVARGEIVVHVWPPDTTKHFVKRLVGLPGDTLSMVRGFLRVNGRALEEPYAWHSDMTVDPVGRDFEWQRDYAPAGAAAAPGTASRNNWGPLVVPAGRYFVLGDNRDNSLDSRYWGFLTAAQLLGRPRRVYFSRNPATGAVRWGRIGRRLE